MLKRDEFNLQGIDTLKVLPWISGDQMKIDRSVAVATDFFDVIKNLGIVSAVDVEIVDTVLVKVFDQLFKGGFLTGIYRSGDLHG